MFDIAIVMQAVTVAVGITMCAVHLFAYPLRLAVHPLPLVPALTVRLYQICYFLRCFRSLKHLN